MSYIYKRITKIFNQNHVDKNSHAVPAMNVTSYVAMVTCLNFSFKHEFESSKDTLWCYMKETNLCIKLTILERCLHYLMITTRTVSYYTSKRETPVLGATLKGMKNIPTHHRRRKVLKIWGAKVQNIGGGGEEGGRRTFLWL